MMGIFAGIEDPVIRDTAWEYIRFYESEDAVRIKTSIMVEGGLGRFINPRYLEMFGYDELIRLAPKGWSETFEIAISTGQPEPYGKHSNLAYDILTEPIQNAEDLALSGDLPDDENERVDRLRALLGKAAAKARKEMLGVVPPKELRRQRAGAVLVLLAIIVSFALVFRKVIRTFTPPEVAPGMKRRGWEFRKYAWAYVILVPALFSVLFWRYVPLLRGSVMAFQDYRIMGGSHWVWLDNYAHVLWNADWWRAVVNSLRYSTLVVSLTFLPPVILAIFLQEVPRGKILYRTLFYLPRIITGLVVILLWKSFYDPTERGTLNAVVLKIPALGFLALGAVLFYIAYSFCTRLSTHQSYAGASAFLVAGMALFYTCFAIAEPILTPHAMSLRRKLGIALAAFAAVALTRLRVWSKAQPPDRQHATPHLLLVAVLTVCAAGILLAKPILWPPDAPLWRRLFMTIPEPYRWLQGSETAMLCCVIPMIWTGMGPGCLIYLAALKGIPDDYYEASDIDGATFIDKILFTVIPMLKPLLIINFVGVFIQSWYGATANILAMTGGAHNTEVVGLHVFYKAFMFLNFGEATAMAWLLAFMLIGFTVYQLRILSRIEFRAAGAQTE